MWGTSPMSIALVNLRNDDLDDNVVPDLASAVAEHDIRCIAGYFGAHVDPVVDALRRRDADVSVAAWCPYDTSITRSCEGGLYAELAVYPIYVLAVGRAKVRT